MPTAKINGIKINFQIQGQGNPLIMIAGFTGNLKHWIFQMPAFKKQYQVITFDNRGSGNSDKPDGPYSAKMMAGDTIALMDHLGIKKAHILGFSMGGTIAQEIAINNPEKVSKLVLVGSWSNKDDSGTGLTPELKQAMQLSAEKIPDEVMNLAVNRAFYRLVFLPMMRRANRRMGTAAYPGTLGQRDACLAYDTSGRLSLIKAPTLVMAGTKDRCIKAASSEKIVKQITNSKLILIENASHTVFLESRRRFNSEVLSFLGS